MSRSLFQTFKNSVIYYGVRVATAIGRTLTLGGARSVGVLVGRLAYRVVPKERDKALRNLALAMPELPEETRRRIARAVFHNLGRSLFEICWLPKLDEPRLRATTTIAGLEHFQAAVDRGRGVVLFTGHCGNWEWMASAIGLLGFRMNVIAREIYDPRLNEFIVASRAAQSVKTIGRGSASSAREILQTLKNGDILGVLIDQNIKAENVMVPFFNRPAPTPIGPAKLAIRSGAAVIVGFIEFRDGKQLIRFQPPIFPTRSDDPAELTATLTAAIEEQIRQAPEQWVWMHERWKVRKSNPINVGQTLLSVPE
ncbi:MAG TPA: lysophospholipid acyltransferase family protein [Thermoanaerobaculia bacterium]|nr:lysophospholipid acyltransferase family protein [Thermoanaerobaculia bacterium]